MQKTSRQKAKSKKNITQKKESIKNSNYQLIGLSIIILLGLIIYSNSFKCSFHFDDFSNIVYNNKLWNIADVKAWWSFNPNRPVAIFSLALNYHFSTNNVIYWHLVNLIIHLANAVLVWWLTLLIFSTPAIKDNKISKYKNTIALIVAFLFVSHPLATQSVTYIVQRMASMVAMFYILSIIFFLKGRLSNKDIKHKIILFAASILSFVLAIFTKENAYTLPFAILLAEIFFIRTNKISISFKDYRTYIVLIGIIAIAVLIFSKFSMNIFKPIPPMLGHTYTLTSQNYLFTQFSVIVKYIQLLILPINQALDYDFPIAYSFFELRTFLSFLLLLSLVILAIYLFNKQRIISFGIFWFFLTLIIESSIIPISDVIFEHRTYLPSFGFFLILVSGLFILFKEKYQYLVVIILGFIIISNSYLTYQRNKVWKNEFTLWNDNVMKTPNKARPVTNRGYEYRNLGKWDIALEDYNKALEINPNYTIALVNRGFAYCHFQEWNNALIDFKKAYSIDPKNHASLSGCGIAYANLGRLDTAIQYYNNAIKINQKYADAYSNRGIAYCMLKDWSKAINDFSKALEINPRSKDTYCNRALAYESIGDWNKAIDDYTSALNIDPNYKVAYNNRQIALKNIQNK